jgi:TonB family protein
MSKLMKFCGKCDEAFADRFVFCPNCGAEMQAFELNPVVKEFEPMEIAAEKSEKAETAKAAAPPAPVQATATPEASVKTEKEPLSAPIVPEMRTAAKTPVTPAVNPDGKAKKQAQRVSLSQGAPDAKSGWVEVSSKPGDTLFANSMIRPRGFRDPRVRASALFGLALVLTCTVGAVLYDLFTKDITLIGPDVDELVFAAVPIDTPPELIKKLDLVEKAKSDQKAGGGGGGGGQDEDPPMQGKAPAFSKTDPLFKPTTHDRTVTNPEMPINPAVKAPIDRPAEGKVGAPKGGSKISDGTGGGGIGNNGLGGVGDNGRDGGYGRNGDGGIGGVPGGGIGNRRGPGIDGDDDNSVRTPPPALKPKPVGVTEGVKILSKPRPSYTEEARKNQVNGTVRLRITFNANGTIGGISPVSGLGFGLTEQAIAAARNIRFEPAKRNGVPYSVAKVVDFGFNIY